VTSLAKLLEWSEKTIRRDLAYLRDSLGAPLLYNPHRRGFFYSCPNYRFPSIAITEGELLGVFLGSQLLYQYRGTALGKQLAGLYAKLADFLPQAVEFDFADLQQIYSTRPAATEGIEPAILQVLFEAVSNNRTLEIIYHSHSSDLTQKRRVDPYGFHLVDSEIYLIAFCHLRKEVRNFHPGRMQELKPTGETFERRADFDLTGYLDAGFRHLRGNGPPQQVTLHFSSNIARHVQNRTWHPTQKTEPQPDGSVLLRFTINHLVEVKRMALSYGSDCEVLEPASLRQEIAADVRKMMAKFESKEGL
jgi:predicted DNA-binding transcriptional regulator YafY